MSFNLSYIKRESTKHSALSMNEIIIIEVTMYIIKQLWINRQNCHDKTNHWNIGHQDWTFHRLAKISLLKVKYRATFIMEIRTWTPHSNWKQVWYRSYLNNRCHPTFRCSYTDMSKGLITHHSDSSMNKLRTQTMKAIHLTLSATPVFKAATLDMSQCSMS